MDGERAMGVESGEVKLTTDYIPCGDVNAVLPNRQLFTLGHFVDGVRTFSCHIDFVYSY